MDFEKAYKWLIKEDRKKYLLKNNQEEEICLFFKSAKEGFIFEEYSFRESYLNNDFTIKDIEEDVEVKITKKISLKHKTKFHQFTTAFFENKKEKYYKYTVAIHPRLFDFLRYIEDKELEVYINKKKKVSIIVEEKYDDDSSLKKRLTITTSHRVNFEVFKHIVNSIILGLGYFSGTFLGEEEFYFQSDNLGFSDVEFMFRNSEKNTLSYLKPISNNIKRNYYSFIDDCVNVEKFNSEVTLRQFETLINNIYTKKVFYTSLSLIRDASVSGIFTRAIILYPAFEALCTLVNDRIKLDDEEKVLREYTFLNILDKYKKEILEEDFLKIKEALKPKNTYTYENTFVRLEQNISDEDKKAFKLRNKLLHGNFLNKNEKLSSESQLLELSKKYLHYYFHIYTLISRIILQEIGFKGYVIQHHQLRKKMTNENKLEEELFIEIK
ncbi:hypothetical protein [Tenacibaculum finnmarkense]|uniref:hypothetical protein n=1 Tax=Tenacibaculum finnmarkense TaxID=2781243 RepID=UPI00187BBD10|nr:hypothetical protein [Tenacibaculum finnmarkense]MBE7691672.1 hypothetical protein [Tenacibaculum finnmarkense genomovar finnmarkense]MCD8401821.1 hypothetical protein [Tenacibaculum finnmarkense genomovar finnmarkense]